MGEGGERRRKKLVKTHPLPLICVGVNHFTAKGEFDSIQKTHTLELSDENSTK